MCEVVSATTMMYMAIASSAVSVYAQKQTADAQSKAIGVQAENERKEVGAKAEEQLGVRIREAREKRARARVAAGESGAMGQSFAAAMNQSLQDQDMDAALISKNLSFAQSGIADRANSSLAGIRSPSALEAGLSIAGAGMSGYSAGSAAEARRATAAEGGP